MIYPDLSPLASPDLLPSLGEAPFETKFLLPTDLARAAGEWACTRLPRDPHGRGPSGVYQVSSLYFDSPQLEIYHRSHTQRVSKYRIRRYGSEDVLYLECKSKHSGRVVKRRTAIPTDELDHVEQAEARPGWAGAWFAGALSQRALRPVCHVSYVRKAWVGELDGQRVRMTLDQELRGTSVTGLELPGTPAQGRTLFDGCVLEIKFASGMPAACRQWMRELGCEPQPVSKYRQAVQVCRISAA